MENIKQIDDSLGTAQLVCTNTDGRTKYDFSNFTFPSKFTLKIFRRDLTLQKAKDDQVNLEILINKLNNNYNPKNLEQIKEKDDILKPTKMLLTFRREIIKVFETGIFPHIDGSQVEKESDEETDEESRLENEGIDATDMAGLESEESAAERRN